jgi:hypothetical protein
LISSIKNFDCKKTIEVRSTWMLSNANIFKSPYVKMKNSTSEENNKNLSVNKREDNINFKLIWNSLSQNYNMVEGTQLSDSS